MKIRDLNPRLFLLLFLLIPAGLRAQDGKILGYVHDSLGQPLNNATVSLVKLSDSTLWGFTLTERTGYFDFEHVQEGRYRVLVNYLGAQQQRLTVEVTAAQPIIKCDTFRMIQGGVTLDAVQIVDEAPPVTLRGDTLEFNAGSFRTAPNAAVEDLLKKLPGVEVASDGTITVNGQTINKVMVDGKEFFGNDPTVATRNLPAEAIKKVQVFDKKSDAEEVSGNDDGQTDMAINLTLKEEHKKGFFGTLTAGGGTQDRWIGKGNLNAFRKNTQFSLIANANNTNERSFSFRDLMQFTGAFQDMMEGGDVNFEMGDDGDGIPLSRLLEAQNKGINTQASGGIRFSQEYKKKWVFTGNYFVSWFDPYLTAAGSRQYFLPDSTYFWNNAQTEQYQNLQHNAQLDIRWRPTSNTRAKLNPAVSLFGMEGGVNESFSTYSADLLSGTAGNNITANANQGYALSNDFRLAKGFKKKGRSISVSLNSSYRSTSNEKDISNRLLYFTPDTTFAVPNVIQQWTSAGLSHNETFRAGWTEPLSREWMGEVQAQAGINEQDNARVTLAYNPITGQFDTPTQQANGNYNSDFRYAGGGLRFRHGGRKMSYAFGAVLQASSFRGEMVATGYTFENRYLNLLPNAMMDYKFSQFRELEFRYRTSVRPATVSQLQPIIDNSNLSFIRYGNPDLNPELRHSLNLEYRSFDPGAGKQFMVFMNGEYRQNGITDSSSVIEGITTTSPVNAGGNWSSSVNLMWGRKIKAIKSRIGIEPNVRYGHSRSYVNGLVNDAGTLSVTPMLEWTFQPTDSFEFEISGSSTWNQTDYTIGESRAFWQHNLSAELTWDLPAKFHLNSRFTGAFLPGGGSNTFIPLWRASISRSFMKKNNLELKISAFDILNQNQGLTKTTVAAYSEIQDFNTLNRYFLASLTWRINPALSNDRPRGGMHMRIMH